MSSDLQIESSSSPRIVVFSLPSPTKDIHHIPPSALEVTPPTVSKPVPLPHQITWTPCPPRINTLAEDLIYLPDATRETLLPFLETLLRTKPNLGFAPGEGDGKVAIPWECLMQLWMNPGQPDVAALLAALYRLGIKEIVLVVGKQDVQNVVKQEQEVGEFAFLRPGSNTGEICRTSGGPSFDFNWNIFMAMFDLWPGPELTWDEIEEKIEKCIKKTPEELLKRLKGMTRGYYKDQALVSLSSKGTLRGIGGSGWQSIRVRFMELKKA
ncbi:uncharacterized protein PAC_16604 [Phialocephala subalpina]|uniref:Uncharacterized protein n=1 Tax=Phialocephala subalpina TaxID=576137 RepID=A0A1L7XNU6_9HELO|nr:uncharacterized protein PAC_16604 [Phialocephala subalpina]